MSKRVTNTDKIELVETQNLCAALNRLGSAPYDSARWKRALYHAFSMSDLRRDEMTKRIREALELP